MRASGPTRPVAGGRRPVGVSSFVTTALAVPAGTRRYVLADTVAGLGTASFRTAVSATVPVVVERATCGAAGLRPPRGVRHPATGGVLARALARPGRRSDAGRRRPVSVSSDATDALGSIRVVFTASGAEVARADYLLFGERFAATGPLPPQQFTGQQRDPEAQLDHFNARSYQTTTGRFTGMDPVYAGQFDPQQWNRYAYARGNPLKYVDPTGLMADSGIKCQDILIDGVPHAVCSDSITVNPGGGGGGGGGGIPGRYYPDPPPITGGDGSDEPLGGGGVGGGWNDGDGCGGGSSDGDPQKPSTGDKLLDSAIAKAEEILQKKKKCRDLFQSPSDPNAGIRALRDTSFRPTPEPAPEGVAMHTLHPHVEGFRHVVYVPRGGPFHNPPQGRLPVRGVNNLRAMMVLHELGHVTHIFGRDAPQDGRGSLGSYHTQLIVTFCF